MPELVHVQKYVYTLDELEPGARRKALEILSDFAWETLPSELIGEMLYDLFCKKGGREDLRDGNQEASVKKLGVTISWSVAYTQGDNVELHGHIDRDSFPGFAWPDGISQIVVTHGRVTENGYDNEANARINAGEDNYARQWTQTMDLIKGLQYDFYWYARHIIDEMTSEQEVINNYNTQLYPRRFVEDGRLAPAEFWQKADYVEPVIIEWTEHDVASLLKTGDEDSPDLEKARDILARVSRHLKGRSIEMGWPVLEALIANEVEEG